MVIKILKYEQLTDLIKKIPFLSEIENMKDILENFQPAEVWINDDYIFKICGINFQPGIYQYDEFKLIFEMVRQ